MSRRLLLLSAAIASTCVLGSARTYAQSPDSGASYPDRPIRLVVGFPPGGTTDVLARLISTALAERLGQPVVVENRAGASGMIGTDSVAKAYADGYTLLFSSSTLATYQSLYARVPFEPIRDLKPVALVASTPYVIVAHPSLPVRSVAELIAYAKANPDKLTYAASVPGGGPHLAAELLKQKTGTKMLYVPYKGSGVIMPDLLGGRLQMAVDNVTIMTQHIRSGAIRGIAVTGPKPSPLLPELPTVSADIPGFNVTGWFGLFAPAKTPESITRKLSDAVIGVLRSDEVSRRMTDLGAVPENGRGDAMRDLLASEISTWSAVIREAGIQTQ